MILLRLQSALVLYVARILQHLEPCRDFLRFRYVLRVTVYLLSFSELQRLAKCKTFCCFDPLAPMVISWIWNTCWESAS